MLRRWLRSHISEKRFKRIAPVVTYLDATSAVCCEFMMLRIVATANHTTPAFSFLLKTITLAVRPPLSSKRIATVVLGALVVLFAKAVGFVALVAAGYGA